MEAAPRGISIEDDSPKGIARMVGRKGLAPDGVSLRAEILTSAVRIVVSVCLGAVDVTGVKGSGLPLRVNVDN